MVELQTRHSSGVSAQRINSDLIKRGLELANSVEAAIQRHPNRVSAGSGLVMPEPVVPQDASWAQVWVKRGLNKYQRGNYLGAVDNFRLAIDKQATLLDAHNGLGSALYKLKDYRKSALVYRQALKLSPNNVAISCNLASSLHHLNYLDQAVQIYEEIIKASPRFGIAFYGLGVSFSKQGKEEQAYLAFQRAIILMPDHAASYYGLGLVQYRLGAIHEASEAFKEAMLIDPIYMVAYQKLMGALQVSA